MPQPSAFAQDMLEQINRARLDPAGAGAALAADALADPGIAQTLRYFGVDSAAYHRQIATLAPQAPLAWNDTLARAAEAHSQGMIAADSQSHQLPGEADLAGRLSAVGYTNWTNMAENLFAFTETPLQGHAGLFIDWGYDSEDFDAAGVLRSNFAQLGDGIQDPAGHRDNILNPRLTEVGISILADSDPGTTVGPFVMTQNFGSRFDAEPMLLGVVFDDADGDGVYDAGEGLSGVDISVAGGGTTTSWDSGGYQIALAPGTYDITFSGGRMTTSVTVTVTMGAQNLKQDLDLDALPAGLHDGSTAADRFALGAGNDTVLARAGDDTLLGSDGDDDLRGQRGADNVVGGQGNDTLRGNEGFDTLRGGEGQDVIIGGDGRDLVFMGGGDDLFADNGQRGAIGADTVFANAGNDTLGGGGGSDVFHGQNGADLLLGRLDDDHLSGGNQNDTLLGGAGNDTMVGGNGRDRAFGGAGDDVWRDNGQGRFGGDLAVGGGGSDTFHVGGGNDTLIGGAGADVFDFTNATGANRILDYQTGDDFLVMERAVWEGRSTARTVEGVHLDFGAGHSLLLAGLASDAGLETDVIFG